MRAIAATNLNLEEAVAAGKFREDLYYRPNVVPLQLPPLRERRQDIPLLIEHFLEKNRITENRRAKTITQDAIAHLCSLDWPGNIRQLEHAIQRAFVLSGARDHLRFAIFSLGASALPRRPFAILQANQR